MILVVALAFAIGPHVLSWYIGDPAPLIMAGSFALGWASVDFARFVLGRRD